MTDLIDYMSVNKHYYGIKAYLSQMSHTFHVLLIRSSTDL